MTSPDPRPAPAATPGMGVNPLQAVLLAALFVIEVMGLVAVGWWGASLGGWLGVVVAVVAVSAMAGLWGLFAAPKGVRRLQGLPLAAFMVAWFTVGGLCLAAIGHPWWGVALVAGFALTKGLLRLTGYRQIAYTHAESAPPPQS